MKKTFIFVLLALFCICGYAQTIDPVLLEEMGQHRDNEKIRVFVIMRQQYDQQQLNSRAAQFTTRAERREFVVNELKQFSETTQYDLRHSLAELQRGDLVSEPKVLWIANAIFFEATREAILSLADRPDIMVIGFDEERNWLPDGEESQPADPTREITSNVTQVNADQVWNLGYTGQGVVVAVIDTGVNYNHLDLADHLWDGGTEFPNHGYDIYYNDNDPMDDHGHGTHCAGTVCGDGTAGSQTGMAPDATLMCVKCLSSGGSCSDSHVITAMQWAVDHGCDVISMSLGGHGHSGAEQTIMRNTCVNVLNAGVIASIAAGNEGDELYQYPIPDNVGLPGGCPPPYLDPDQELNPGGLSCSVCVGAVNSNDQAADFTSHGPRDWSNSDYADYPYTENSQTEFGLIRPDVCAPGVSIKSADYSSNTGYSTKSGTSMATPCVAGCMALMLSKNPDATPADLCRILEETAVSLSTGKSNIYGCGRVDVLAAVNALYIGPLTIDSYTINDATGNNDGKLNPGESVSLNFTLVNDETMAIDGATMVLSTESEYVTITNGTATLPHFNPGQTRTIQNIFAFTLDDNAPAKRSIQFTAETFINGESVGMIRINVMVYNYTLRLDGVTVLNDNNGNGMLEAGETANLHVVISNIGNNPAYSIVGTLSASYPYLTINSTTQTFGNIGINGQAYANFNVTMAGNAPEGYTIDFSLDLVDANNKHSILEFELWKKAITLTSNPEEGGVLSGGGYYGQGQTCTVTATPNEGYVFCSWTENDEVVSLDPNYSFIVTDGRNLVANFIQTEEDECYIVFNLMDSYGDGWNGNKLVVSYSTGCLDSEQFTFDNGYSATFTRKVINGSHIVLSWITGSYTSECSFKVSYEGDLVIYQSSGTLNSGFLYEFDSNCGAASAIFNVNVTSDNPEHGTVSGGGEFGFGQTCMVTATPAEGYYFVGWSQDGTMIPDALATYSFIVHNDMNLVAHFSEGIMIGDGGTATNQYLPSYSYYKYTLSQQIYTSEELGAEGLITSIAFYNNGTEKTRAYDIYLKTTEKTSFANTTDWETVSASDKVFSGSVTMEAGAWTIITFDTPFLYDGSSNLVLVTDDNTGSYSLGMNCRVFNAPTQSIYIYSDNTNYDPFNPSSYTGTLLSVKNQLLVAKATPSTDPLIVTVSANPAEGGTMNGGGEYGFGETCTVTAIPNTGYFFMNWTENGIMVSNNATYSFNVYGNRNLVANFVEEGSICNIVFDLYDSYGDGWNGNCLVVDYGDGTSEQLTFTSGSSASYSRMVATGSNIALSWISGNYINECSFDISFENGIPIYHGSNLSSSFQYEFTVDCAAAFVQYTISAVANPTEGGEVSGTGVYGYGNTCTLIATANEGYTFLYWMENGTMVSLETTYSFIVDGDRNLVANFVEEGTMCNIVFDLYDSYGDGWNGNCLVVDYGDGTSEQLTFTSGSSASYSRLVAMGSHITLIWVLGSFVSECSFDISFENGVQIYHGSSLNSSFQYEFIVNCADAYAPRIISAVADPEEGGTVGGAGTYDGGTTCTLTATPNEGYSFCFWSENGQQVSTDASYSFIVSSDRDLVARFSLPLTVSVTTNLTEGGTVTGAGTFDYGNYCTLTATPNEGYLFLNWSKNGEVVSCNATYSFTVTEDVDLEAVFMLLDGTLIGQGESTNQYLPSYSYYNYTLSQQIYTPDEIGEAGSITTISYFNAGVTKTRSYDIYMVHTDKLTFDSNTDWITVSETDRVYSGSVIMTQGNWTTIFLDTPFAYDGVSNLAVIVDDNTGTWSSGMVCRVFNADGNQTIRVYSDGTNYDPINPSSYSGTLMNMKNQIILGITPLTVEQTIILSQGWNWFNTYIEVNNPVAMLDMLKEGLGNNAVQIQAAENMTEYDGEDWFGDLDDLGISNEQTYLIEMGAPCTVELQGMPANPANHVITINYGWNWIGFPSAEPMDVVEAFAGFEAEEEDQIMSQNGMTEFDGEEWFGDLETLEPGQGLMYFSNSTETKTLIYQTGTKQGR